MKFLNRARINKVLRFQGALKMQLDLTKTKITLLYWVNKRPSPNLANWNKAVLLHAEVKKLNSKILKSNSKIPKYQSKPIEKTKVTW